MADFQVKVYADTDDASRKVQKLDSDVTDATKDRSIKIDVPNLAEVAKGFQNLDNNIKTAANDIKTFWQFADFVPGIGATKQLASNLIQTADSAKQAGIDVSSAGKAITSSIDVAARSTSVLTDRLLGMGAAVFLIKQSVDIVKGAFTGFFNETIGREIQLRETMLKTQTALASTNQVFKNGKEITDPYQKIVSLTSEVAKHVDSIRDRSIALAGVTSNDVIELFGIVAQQVGQIGGGLKEAEDLAINFAGALGTFNIPLYQAQQEISSILRGDITTDSYLAKALGITNNDIARAKTQIGGVTKFLETKLAAAVAGQRIAAEGFAGVWSNIRDLQELVGQKFGSGLLDPLLDSLTKVFEFLFKIKDQIFAIAKGAGNIIGSGVATVFGQIQGRSTLAQKAESSAPQFLSGAQEQLKGAATTVQSAMAPVIGQLTTLLERAAIGIAALVKGLAELAKGFLSLQISNFQAIIGALESLSQVLVAMAGTLGGVLTAWGNLLRSPIVQEFSRIQTIFGVLTKTGLPDMVSKILLVAGAFASWNKIMPFIVTQFNLIRTILGSFVVGIGRIITAFANLGSSIARAAEKGGAAIQALGVEIGLLSKETEILGQSVQRSGDKLGGLGLGIEKAKGGLTGLAVDMIKTNLTLFALQAAVSIVIDIYSRWKEKQDEIASDRRAEVALQRLNTTYKNLGDNATAAQKRARDFERALVDAQYNKAVTKIEEIREKINQLRYELKPGIQSWGEFWAAVSGSEIGRFEQGNKEAIAQLLKDMSKQKEILNRYEREKDKQDAESNLRLVAQRSAELAKARADLERELNSKVFEQRQQAASKEVEVFRAAGELRIYQMEQANKKLIEGEEGASRTALEALNTYLSTKKRGELEIEAAKKTLNIEIANLEKALVDYRYEVEQKIAKLRNDASDNEKAAAEARANLATASGGAVPADVAGRQDKAVQYFTDKGLPRISAAALVGGLTQESGLSSTIENKKSGALGIAQWTDGRKSAMLQSGAGANFNKQLDFIWHELLGPENASYQKLKSAKTLNQALLGAASFERFNGYQAIGAGNEWGSRIAYTNNILNRAPGGAPSRPPSSAPSQASALATPSADPAFAPALAAYGSAVGNVTRAMERLRALQAALTDAKTVQALEAIANSVFQPVELEQYQDKLNEVKITYLAIAASSGKQFDPERSKIEIDSLVKKIAAARELYQIESSIRASTLLDAKEKQRIIEGTDRRYNQYLKSLKAEEVAQRGILAIQRGNEALLNLRTGTAGIYKEIEVTKLQNRLEAEGVSPERIAAEVAKLQLKQRMVETQNQLNQALEEQRIRLDNLLKQQPTNDKDKEALQKQINDARDTIKSLEKQLAQLPKDGKAQAQAIDDKAAQVQDPVQSLIGKWNRELRDTKTMIASLGQTIESELGSAMSNAITGVINGTSTVQDAFGTMFQNIGKAFIDMATQMIAKALILQVLGLLSPGSSKLLGFAIPETLSPGLSPRASGGPIEAGTPYIVGELGPELFLPSQGGYVINANQTQRALAQSRAALTGAARGANSSADNKGVFSENRDALNETTSMSRERQVERWLTSGATSSEIKYSRVGSGDLPFVTEQDMLQATRIAAQEGARMGQQRTMAALKNNPGARRSIGI